MRLHGGFNIAAFARGTSGRIQFQSAPWPRQEQNRDGAGVRKNTIVMVGIAVVFGLLAVFVAQGWLNYQAELSRKTVAPKPQQVATRTIVVAAAPLRFGTHVAPDSLREVSWPDDAIPGGHLHVDRRTDRRRQAHRARLDRAQRADPAHQDHRTGPEGDAVGRDPGRHARRDGAHQRRRGRRGLRAAGRPCGRAAHAPVRAHHRHERRGDPERARARGRSARRRRGRPADGRARGHARGRYRRRRRRSRSRRRSAIFR